MTFHKCWIPVKPVQPRLRLAPPPAAKQASLQPQDLLRPTKRGSLVRSGNNCAHAPGRAKEGCLSHKLDSPPCTGRKQKLLTRATQATSTSPTTSRANTNTKTHTYNSSALPSLLRPQQKQARQHTRSSRTGHTHNQTNSRAKTDHSFSVQICGRRFR